MSTAKSFPHPELPPDPKKGTKQEAARELLRIAKEDMESKGLPEEEQNSRAESFIDYVDFR